MWAQIREFWLKEITPGTRVKRFCGVLLAGMGLALAVSAVNLLLHRAYYPYVTFLFDPRYRFNDFYDTLQIALGEQNGNYFPFFVWALQGLKFLPEKVSLYTMLAGGTVLYFSLACRAFSFLKQKWSAAAIFTLCSFPLLFALDRANTEIILFAVCAAFLLCYRAKRFWWAALLLALAINMKLYPAVFLVLFMADKRSKALAGTVLFSGVLLAVGKLSGFGFDSSGFAGFNLWHQLMPLGLQFSHSFFNLICLPVFLLTQVQGSPESWEALLWFSRQTMPYYAVFALGFFAFASAYTLFINHRLARAALLLTLGEVFLPFVSYDYTLIQLALPALLLLKDPQEKADNLTVFLLALLFVPMNLISHCFLYSYFDFVMNLGSFLRPVISLVLLVHLMRDFSFASLIQGIKKYYGPKAK
ncbi:glycosyltransferase family 87 protein [Candidatus Avelusimicrobium sp.]|uniref:glycosyltransferase family 87 protein n=1 Tax=Candidatus Avelusimicrobium sp. TaxID=3048833 RepID=UPI003D7D1B2C